MYVYMESFQAVSNVLLWIFEILYLRFNIFLVMPFLQNVKIFATVHIENFPTDEFRRQL